jgi:hypothetical protein
MATGIMALLAKPKKGGASKEALAPMGDMGGGGESDETGDALMEMFDALKGGDRSGASLAFKRAYASCEHGEPDGDEMGGESDEDVDDLDL